jgi:ketosteroid isomerase-like protein
VLSVRSVLERQGTLLDTFRPSCKSDRMKRWTMTFGAALFVTAFVTAQRQIPAELQALADMERAFAKAAVSKGIRDSFLEYFDDEAIAFSPAPTSAKARLRARPSRPFTEHELTWEPRTGDVAGSGELGWLTGPSTFIDRTDPKAPLHYGNYLSVWRRQPGGAWRVFIDVGVDAPEPVQFPPGFTRLPFGPRYTRTEEKTAPSASLLSADRALNDRIATAGAADAYVAVMTDASRLHRRGFMPSIGRSAAQKWMAQHATSMTASTGAANAARSADLGYSYGTYQVSGTKPENGGYVRVWTRDAAGKWFVVADVTQRIPNP